MNRNIIVVIILFSINFCLAQLPPEIVKLDNKVENDLARNRELMEAEIKKLPSKDYYQNKIRITNKHNDLGDEIIKQYNIERKKVLERLQKEYEIEKENEKQLRELDLRLAEEKKVEERLKQEEEHKILMKQKEKEIDSIRAINLRKEQELEKIREEERKIYEFNNSDKGKLYSAIRTKFNAWIIKSDSESDFDYKKRIENESLTYFNKIKKEVIIDEKSNLPKIASICLEKYDLHKEEFLVAVSPQEYTNRKDTISQFIKIPKGLATFLNSNFNCSRGARFGVPAVMFVLDYELVGNYWFASRILFVFPSEKLKDTSKYANKPYLDSKYVFRSKIEEKKGEFTVVYSLSNSLKPLKLKNIKEYFGDHSLDFGSYYYEWKLDDSIYDKLDINLKDIKQ